MLDNLSILLLSSTHDDYCSKPIDLKTEVEAINVCLKEKQLNKAEELIQNLTVKYKDYSEFPIKLGHLLFIQKKYSRAEAFYKQALSLSSVNERAEVYFSLGQVYFHSQLYLQSLEAFGLLVDNFPDYHHIDFVYLRLARSHNNLGDYNAACEYLIKIIKRKKCNRSILAESFCMIGEFYVKQGRNQLSIQMFYNAVKTIKNFRTIVCITLGLLQNNPVVAESICKKYLRRDRPKNEWSDINFLRALALAKMGDTVKALSILEEERKAFPLNLLYLQNIGILYSKIGEFHKALDVFLRVQALCPINSTNLNNIAVIYKKLGLKEQAIRIINKIPGNYETEENSKLEINIRELELEIKHFPSNID